MGSGLRRTGCSPLRPYRISNNHQRSLFASRHAAALTFTQCRCAARAAGRGRGAAGWCRTSPGHEIRKRPLAGQTNGRRKPLASKCWRAGSQSGKEACQARGTFKGPDLSQTGESPDRDALAPHRCTPPGNKEAPLIRTRWGASVWTTPQRSALGEGSEGHGQRCTRPRSWSTNPALQKPNTEPVTSKKREGASDECLAPSLDRPTRCGMQWARHRNGPDRGLVRKVTFSSAAIAR